MRAVCLDDEALALTHLCSIVEKAEEIESAIPFTDADVLTEWAKDNMFDIAFLDIQLRGSDGISAAKKLKEYNPECGIIFCTGYPNYAIDAIESRVVDGYLVKPIFEEDVAKEIRNILAHRSLKDKFITVNIGERLTVFDSEGKLIVFKRKKSEELFGLLIEHKGNFLETSKCCKIFWGENADMEFKNKQYFWQLITDIKTALKSSDMQDIIINNNGAYALDMTKIIINYV